MVEGDKQRGVISIHGQIQNYDWGIRGEDSKVAKIALGQGATKNIESTKPYAELWMGTHPKKPCKLVPRLEEKGEAMLLSDVLKSDPEYWLGQELVATLNQELITSSQEADQGNIPFLFKVLSVNQALSIQVHPDKDLAKKLCIRNPELYDGNHKPEIAIPISETFEALCAFRQLDEIKGFINSIEPLKELMGPEFSGDNLSSIQTIKPLYEKLMRTPGDVAKAAGEKLEKIVKEELSINNKGGNDKDDRGGVIPVELLPVLKDNLIKHYPGDIGLFSIFFLNYCKIQQDPANPIFIFCAANVPHAYLKGDCIECMAMSDNVVRAGLTPKFKDVELLLQMVDYDAHLDGLVGVGKEILKNKLWAYNPPPNIKDFKVLEVVGDNTTVKHNNATIHLFLSDVKIEVDGDVQDIRKNSVLFTKAGAEIKYSERTSGEGVRVFVATS